VADEHALAAVVSDLLAVPVEVLREDEPVAEGERALRGEIDLLRLDLDRGQG
jgi:hypothetical protein